MSIKDKLPIVGSYDCHQRCMWIFSWILLVVAVIVTNGLFVYFIFWSTDAEVWIIPIFLTGLFWIVISTWLVKHGISNNTRLLFIPIIGFFAIGTSIFCCLFLFAFRSFIYINIYPQKYPSPGLGYAVLFVFAITISCLLILLYSIGLFAHHTTKWTRLAAAAVLDGSRLRMEV